MRTRRYVAEKGKVDSVGKERNINGPRRNMGNVSSIQAEVWAVDEGRERVVMGEEENIIA